jgi:DNA ligase-associated metallophosphoesterase
LTTPIATVGMEELTVNHMRLQLLPQKAIYVEALEALLVSDVHLGKSETFQQFGVPIPSQVNRATLQRLQALCDQYHPRHLWILGDLFHSRRGMADEVIDAWLTFLHQSQVQVYLILGNHDRPLQPLLAQLAIECFVESVEAEGLVLSHEPLPPGDSAKHDAVNICGHVHPCMRLTLGCDRLRLPCFHWQVVPQRLTLPSFGEFTGGYEVQLSQGDVAYVVADDQVVAFEG